MAMRQLLSLTGSIQTVQAAHIATQPTRWIPQTPLCSCRQWGSLVSCSILMPCNRQSSLGHLRRWSSPLSTQAESTGAEPPTVTLRLYSKPECHLCDGLKEKIHAALAKAKYMPSELSGATLEIRDITTKREWEQQYGLVIPVLSAVMPGTTEEIKIPRVPPRSTADRVAVHIISALPK